MNTNESPDSHKLLEALRSIGAVDVSITRDTLRLTINGTAYAIEGTGLHLEAGELLVEAY